jgi:hypothetical protein
MNHKYEQAISGEWFTIEGRKFHQMCCGCGFVHVWHLRVNADGSISLKPIEKKAATRAARKRYGIEVKGKMP